MKKSDISPVDFRVVFIENALKNNEEENALAFFKLIKDAFNYDNDKDILDHFSLLSQREQSTLFIKELESMNVPCDTLKYRLVQLEEDTKTSYEFYVNEMTYNRDEFIAKYNNLDNALIVPSVYEKNEFENEMYEKMLDENDNAVFDIYDFGVYLTLKYHTEQKINNTSLNGSLINKAFAYTDEDLHIIAKNICSRIKENSFDILYSKIDERIAIKKKIIEYFEENSFYVSNNDSSAFSSNGNIIEAINRLQYSESDGNSYIQNDKDDSILVTNAFYVQNKAIDWFKVAVKNIKKELYKTHDEDLNQIINQDLFKKDANSIVVFDGNSPVAIFTDFDFKIPPKDLKDSKTINVFDLAKALEREEFKDSKKEIIKKINDIYAEKSILEYLGNKFESQADENTLKLIKESLRPIGAIVNYKSKDSEGLREINIYTDKNKDTLLDYLKDIPNLQPFTKDFKEIDTKRLEDISLENSKLRKNR